MFERFFLFIRNVKQEIKCRGCHYYKVVSSERVIPTQDRVVVCACRFCGKSIHVKDTLFLKEKDNWGIVTPADVEKNFEKFKMEVSTWTKQ